MEHVGLIAALLCSQKHQSGHGMKHLTRCSHPMNSVLCVNVCE